MSPILLSYIFTSISQPNGGGSGSSGDDSGGSSLGGSFESSPLSLLPPDSSSSASSTGSYSIGTAVSPIGDTTPLEEEGAESEEDDNGS